MNAHPLFQHGNIVIKRCKHGYLAFNRFDDTVSLCLSLYGEWCEEELDFFSEVVACGEVVLDVGAYIGTHTVCFAQQVGPTGRVIAFEPQRASFQLLCTNLTLNALYNVRTIQAGVSHEAGQIRLPVIDPYTEGNHGALSLEDHRLGEPLPLITLDSLALEQCDHIKIDVEGTEQQVLQGAQQTIAQFRPVLYIENNTLEHSRGILEQLTKLKYDCWWHLVPYFNPSNFFDCQDNIFLTSRRPFEANIACFPTERQIVPERLLRVEGLHDNWQLAFQRIKENKTK